MTILLKYVFVLESHITASSGKDPSLIFLISFQEGMLILYYSDEMLSGSLKVIVNSIYNDFIYLGEFC